MFVLFISNKVDFRFKQNVERVDFLSINFCSLDARINLRMIFNKVYEHCFWL